MDKLPDSLGGEKQKAPAEAVLDMSRLKELEQRKTDLQKIIAQYRNPSIGEDAEVGPDEKVLDDLYAKLRSTREEIRGITGEKPPGEAETAEKAGRYDEKYRKGKIRKMFRDFDEKISQIRSPSEIDVRERLDPQKEVEKSISELGLEETLPKEFRALPKEAQYMVMQNLKQRIAGVVKSEAEIEYAEHLGEKGQNLKEKAGKFFERIVPTKAERIKRYETKKFWAMQETTEGKQFITENLDQLTYMIGGREIKINEDNKAEIVFINPAGYGEKEKRAVAAFNTAANNFREIPYEWGQTKSILKKRKFEKAKEEYDIARAQVLSLEIKKRKDPTQVLCDMLIRDNIVYMDQLINTHPEIEKELKYLARNAGIRESVKDILQIWTGGGGLPNKTVFLGGFGARAAVSGFATSIGIFSLAATSTVGAAIGTLRGYIQSAKTLEDRKKQARYGKKDTSKEKVLMSDASHLARQLDRTVAKISYSENKKNRQKNLALLDIRMKHVVGKMEKGLVNFGDPKSALNNQFVLIETLNKAITLSASLSEQAGEETEKRINGWLETVAKQEQEKISEAKRDFIKKQMRQGALLGAGAATVGYLVRWAWEYLAAWWTERSMPTPETVSSAPTIIFQSPVETFPDTLGVEEMPETTPVEVPSPIDEVDIARAKVLEHMGTETETMPVSPEEITTPKPISPSGTGRELKTNLVSPSSATGRELRTNLVSPSSATGRELRTGALGNSFLENTYPVSAEILSRIDSINDSNIARVFPVNTRGMWNMVSSRPSAMMLGIKETEIGEHIKPLVAYLHKLQETTRLEPKSGETVREYVLESLKRAAKMGQLDRLKM